ncbi:MAG: Gfo/Idh/MocA family oxidoreductase [Candidatus Cloacimonetes bacterium]|nr:Gfo/Idh/MocA family oxidoreductase [Candidatus Cloacimonadota bacterium]
MKVITAVLLGAGDRGMGAYAPYSLKHPDRLKMVAVAEPDTDKRKKFQALHQIDDAMCFENWEDLLANDKLADIALVCTQDRMHFEPTMQALDKGYHVLLEKPMSPDLAECIQMVEKAEEKRLILSVCHVLRYTKFFQTLKKIIKSGKIGEIICIQHNENVGYWHQAHSFVRGHWRNKAESNPMILAKSCHDMDILSWLIDSDCRYISSFGSLKHFKKENAPEGAPLRCLDGCPVEDTCPYHVAKWYLGENIGWPTSVISPDTSYDARLKALKEGPFGRCVYHCDNDVVDHQVVIAEFENQVSFAFTMCAFNKGGRSIKVMGSKGEIRALMEKNEIEILDFETENKEVITVSRSASGHGGGDFGIISDFVKLVQVNKTESLTSGRKSLESHVMAFAAEESRISHQTINLSEFVKR